MTQSNKIISSTAMKVGVLRDLSWASLVAIITIGVWSIAFSLYGVSTKINTAVVTFLGGVLAISGLLFRQYMLKEVLDYLKSWDRMVMLIADIRERAIDQGIDDEMHIRELYNEQQQAQRYSIYVQRELILVPVIPLFQILFYGCALVAENSTCFRVACLFLMILSVAYLAIAALSSTRLILHQPDLDKTIIELEELCNELVARNKDV